MAVTFNHEHEHGVANALSCVILDLISSGSQLPQCILLPGPVQNHLDLLLFSVFHLVAVPLPG